MNILSSFTQTSMTFSFVKQFFSKLSSHLFWSIHQISSFVFHRRKNVIQIICASVYDIYYEYMQGKAITCLYINILITFNV